ncbi:MAG: phenylalanine--tRNA ligase subunit alpha [Spirochaetales bacterium]|nr:phenylalanine--tRNA ligase subunit alpha [Spirochaetales bacterium]
MEIDMKNLHPLEVRLLRHVQAGEEITTERIVQELNYKVGQCNQAFSWLEGKSCIQEKRRDTQILYELTDLGRSYKEEGFPAERIFKLIRNDGPKSMPEIAESLGLENRDVGSAFGQLSKSGILEMNGERKVTAAADSLPESITILKELVSRGDTAPLMEAELTKDEKKHIKGISKKRGAASAPFKISEREVVVYTLTEKGEKLRQQLIESGMTGEELGALTPEILSTGSWRGKNFRSYNVQSPPTRVLLGRRNPYNAYLTWVKDKLISLGFEEFDGPLVETEFWNGDALFMPQFHSARDIHDVYYVKNPSHAESIEQPYLDQIASAHEDGWKTGSRGWGYSFDHDFTRRQVLRSQGTVLSAKTLPKAKVPGKYFGIARCFRYDQVDATHGADFYQTEGIVLGKEVNLRTLLGLLKMFAEEVAGAEEVRYVPGYFPFTEPSIEVHIKHPKLGWFELGGSGIFRPEVSKSLGVDVPVLAWGLGIDRMALMHLGLNDLRELFTPDIERVRLRRGK